MRPLSTFEDCRKRFSHFASSDFQEDTPKDLEEALSISTCICLQIFLSKLADKNSRAEQEKVIIDHSNTKN